MRRIGSGLRGLLVGAAALALAGCSGLTSSGQLSTESVGGQSPNLSNRNVFTGVFGPVTAPATAPQATDPNEPLAVRCPAVEVRTGTETLRTFDAGAAGNEERLRWQATIADTARECRSFPTEATYSVGLAGRIVLGPTGAPGSFTVPVRVVVRRGDEQVLVSRLVQVPVSVPAGAGRGEFQAVISDLRVPRQPRDTLRDVEIYVGFDPMPERPARPARGRQRTARAG